MSAGPSLAVITVVHGRHDRLDLQQRVLDARGAGRRVVVAMGDPEAARIAVATGAEVVEIDAPGGLPLAAARNAGARAALDAGADLLVFLDVDCLGGPDLLPGYARAARREPGSLLCGPVTYLPPLDLPDALDALDEVLSRHRAPHAARPDPAPGELVRGEAYELFWSLSFAVTAATWARLGGFCEEYVGYGGEDTDLAFAARAAGVPLVWVGGADAYHRHHPVSRPPVEHVDDILRNGAIFTRRWGAWPMVGWLEEFERLGLVERVGDGWARAASPGGEGPVRVLSIPAAHPYVAHLADPAPGAATDVVRLPDPPVPGAPAGQWWPPVALEADWIAAHAAEFDVVHVHFGVEGRTLDQLDAWLAALREAGRPLVVTVHDLHNPHLPDNAHHRAQLDRLVPAADVVLTLTEAAAAIVEREWGVSARVVPHPHIVPLERIDELASGAGSPGDGFLVGVHLKSLRADLAPEVVRAVAQAVAADPRLRLRLDVNDNAEVPSWVRELAAAPRVELRRHPRFSDHELFAYLAGLDLAVLPYAFGTHSGWLEACVDVGTAVLAPADGCYTSQHPVGTFDRADLPGSVARGIEAARAAGRRRLVDRASRTAQRRTIAAAHARAYTDALRATGATARDAGERAGRGATPGAAAEVDR